MVKKAEITLEYQNLIPAPPLKVEALHHQSCQNDSTTVKHWRDLWVSQTRANKEQVGSFKGQSIGMLHNAHRHKPCIVAGSGPSLAGNGAQLRERGDIPLVSCLHNFHFFEDRDVKVDYYVSLDAGPVVLDEISEGGKLSAADYWERTANSTLLCYIGSHPDLIKKWKGRLFFFNAPIPDDAIQAAINEIEPFHIVVGSGGNVLGACLYIAKGILGCNPIAFTGADFCFGYDKRFHGWDSKYDKELGECLHLTDIYGIKRKTWPSYANFKCWFEYVACQVPGIYFNCSEGGCLGSYPEGNIAQFRYCDLSDFLEMYTMSRHLAHHCANPEDGKRIPILF